MNNLLTVVHFAKIMSNFYWHFSDIFIYFV